MLEPDVTNALFEAVGAVIIWLNIKRIYRDKIVRGYDWRVMLFFVSWGFWNLYYYPHLDQWWSFLAGIGIAVTNTVYLFLLVYYIRKEKANEPETN